MSITLDGDNLATVGVLNSGTAQATTSGTFKDFTGIPAGVKRITVMLNGVSTNGTSGIRVQVGASGTIVSSGYIAASFTITTAVAASTTVVSDGFPIPIASSSSVQQGQLILCRVSDATWTCDGSFLDNLATARIAVVSGRVAGLTSILDTIRITTTGGTDTFDAGSVNIFWE